MKLAEALTRRKQLKDEIEQLKQRAGDYALVQEGNKPVGSSEDILTKIEEKIGELEELIITINRTNFETELNGEETIMSVLARRDMLKLKEIIVRFVAQAATVGTERFSRNEIRQFPTVDVIELQQRADGLAKEYRLLDARIQAKNWEVEI